MSNRSFEYNSRNAKDAIETAQGNASKYYGYIRPGIPIWTPSKDRHRIRILPPTYSGRKRSFGYRVTVHPNVGPDSKTFLCLSAMRDQPDPVEERLSEARRYGDDKERWARDMKARDKVPTYIIDRDDMDAGVQLWPMPDAVDAKLNAISTNATTGRILEIEHPDEGYDVEVDKIEEPRKDGKPGHFTTYDVVRCRKSCPISDDRREQDEWLQWITDNPLDEVLVFHTYEQIREALGEASHGGRDRGRGEVETRADRRSRWRDDDDDDRGRGRGSSRRRSYDDDDDRGSRSHRSWRDEADDGDSDPERGRSDSGRRRSSDDRGRERDDDRPGMDPSRVRWPEDDDRPSRGRREPERDERDPDPDERDFESGSRRRKTGDDDDNGTTTSRRRRSSSDEDVSDRDDNRGEDDRPTRRRRSADVDDRDRDEERRASAPVDEAAPSRRRRRTSDADGSDRDSDRRSERRRAADADDGRDLRDDVGSEGLPERSSDRGAPTERAPGEEQAPRRRRRVNG